jgi:vitamin B12 transporter
LRPLPSLAAGVSDTWLDTRVDDSGFDTQPGDGFLEGDRLLRRPTHSVRFDGRFHFARRVSLGAALTYVGDRDDVDFRPFPSVRTELPSYTILDLDASASFPLGRGVDLTPTVRVENALDEAYETVVGFPGRKRAVLAGARVSF